MDAYCVKCKEKREIQDPKAEFNTGRAVTTGNCPVCGTKMYRMGSTDEHDPLTQPEKGGPMRRRGETGDRRIAGQSQHGRALPGQGLHVSGFRRPCARSAAL